MRDFNGPLRPQSPIAEQKNRRKDEHQAAREEQAGTSSTKGLGLDHEPQEGCLQPGLQQDDEGLLGTGDGDDGWVGYRRGRIGHELVVFSGVARAASSPW